MKRLLLFVLLTIPAMYGFTQEYRLGYEGHSLPELYNKTHVFAEVKRGGTFQKLPENKYRLSTTDATLKGNLLSYNREQLYKNNGLVRFMLHTDNKVIPLTLDLPVLEDVRINLYTDSIKPILNYYLNVEGKFSNGRIFPVDTSFVTVLSDVGSMNGLEWVLPKVRNFDKVNFTVINKFRPSDKKDLTLYLKKNKDPRDDPDYQDRSEEEIIRDRRR